MIKKYRKKPVEAEAIHLVDLSYKMVLDTLNFMGNPIKLRRSIGGAKEDNARLDDYMTGVWRNNGIQINTLEGIMIASVGDYIIKGIQGEFYPCKPNIFEQTYEEVEETKWKS